MKPCPRNYVTFYQSSFSICDCVHINIIARYIYHVYVLTEYVLVNVSL